MPAPMAEHSNMLPAGVISRSLLAAFNLGLASLFCLSVASNLACGHCTSVAGRVVDSETAMIETALIVTAIIHS